VGFILITPGDLRLSADRIADKSQWLGEPVIVDYNGGLPRITEDDRDVS
jgi:hypothetical protein